MCSAEGLHESQWLLATGYWVMTYDPDERSTFSSKLICSIVGNCLVNDSQKTTSKYMKFS